MIAGRAGRTNHLFQSFPACVSLRPPIPSNDGKGFIVSRQRGADWGLRRKEGVSVTFLPLWSCQLIFFKLTHL